MRQITTKYGYKMEECWHRFAWKPFELEKRVQAKLTDFRVSALTPGESNEWYAVDEERLITEIETEYGKLYKEYQPEVN